MGKASPIQTSFSAGELSPLLEGRVDLAKYSNGTKLSENFLLTVQGPAVRRAGTRYVAPIKNSANKTWLLHFEFNTTQAYILEFGDGYIRFFANHGQVIVSGVAAYNNAIAYAPGALVVSGGINYYCKAATTGNAPPNATYWYAMTGNIFEIPSPYSAADLTSADGTLNLRYAQSGDIIYIAHPGHQPQKLSRFGPTNWTVTPVANKAGPFKSNPDVVTTVYADNNTGAVTLTASTGIFKPGHVGSLFYLGENDVRNLSQWQVGIAYTAGYHVRSNGVNYVSVNAATSGNIRPQHTSGTADDGSPGVEWQYLDAGYGYVQITGYTSPTVVTGTVVSRIPDLAVTSTFASTHWALGAWSDDAGYPSQVTFFRERLTFAGGIDVWFSVTGDYENFDPNDPLGQIAADGALSIQIVARKVNQVQWLDSGTDLIIGTAGGEFRCHEMTNNQVFGPGNVTVQPQSEYGSKGIAPLRVGASVVYVQRSGRKVREMAYDYSGDSYKSTDLTVLSEHVSRGGLVSSDFQQEPFSVIWYARADGMLVGLTFNREQDVVGWHRHPIGGAGIVESVACIPTPDGTRNEVWMLVRRTINGASVRYVEFMEVEHQPAGVDQAGDDIQKAFYVDSGLTYDGAVNAVLTPGAGADVDQQTGVGFAASAPVFVPGDVGRNIHYRYLQSTAAPASLLVTQEWVSAKAAITAYVDAQHVTCTIDKAFPSLTPIAALAWRMTTVVITGLNHLEGMTVDVLNNGASHPQKTVLAGQIELQYPGSVVQVGLACPCRLWTMRLNAGAQDGTSQGKTARINKVDVRFLESVGAQYGPDPFGPLDDLPFRSTGDAMDEPPPLFTGDKLVEFDGDYGFDPRVYIQNNQPFPTSVVMIAPSTHVYDR